MQSTCSWCNGSSFDLFVFVGGSHKRLRAWGLFLENPRVYPLVEFNLKITINKGYAQGSM